MTENIGYILDTDPWYDPDDLFAIHYLLNSDVTPDLIVTGDEVGGKRAKLTRWFLEQLGRDEIKVVEGPELLEKTKIFCEGLITDKKYDVSGNVVEEIRKVVESKDKTIYLGIAAMSNIGMFEQAYPELSDKISLYQMGGSLDLKSKKTEHNVRIDIHAARRVIKSGIETHLVLLDTTLNPVYEISNEHRLYKYCKKNNNLGVRAIAQNVDEFNESIGFWTYMHDPLTVSAALDQDFVDFYEARISMDERGVLKLDDDGKQVYLSTPTSKDSSFMEHFAQKIIGDIK